jgi:hypothetical protein
LKRPQVNLMEKQRNWQHVIWCRTTSAWANRVTIVSSVITKIFYPCKHWTVMIQPHFVMFSESINSYSLPVLLLLSVVWFSSYIRFCSALFDWLCSVIQCLIIRLLGVFYVLILELCSRYFDPHINYILQVNKHHTSDSAIFCLSIGSDSLLLSLTLVGYPEPIFPNQDSGGRKKKGIWSIVYFLNLW